MKKKFFLSICTLSLIIYTSCATKTIHVFDENKSIYITDSKFMNILPTASFSGIEEHLQMIEGSYSGQEFVMQTIVLLTSDQLSVTAFSTFGNTIYDLQYQDNRISYETLIDVSGGNPAYMIADIQLCYYPQEQIRQMVEDADLQFFQKDLKNGWIRTVSDGDSEIITIEKNNKILNYTNHLRNYEYKIEEL